MKVIVYPHDLEIGGSQLNAIEIAAATQSLGHEVAIFGQRGPLVARVKQLGLEFLESPEPRLRPTRSIVRKLRDLALRRGIDVLHGYEWPPILEARAACLGGRASTVGTVMSMAVAPFIPLHVPLVVGTQQIAARLGAQGRPKVDVIEPPVDTNSNRPDPGLGASARAAYGLPDDALVVASVSRLVPTLKLEGLLCAISTLPAMGRDITLLIAGTGSAQSEVERAATRANALAGRRAVVLVGELDDPRPVYAAADIFLGMGGSVLRAMAFEKPVIVQGELGFWELLTPQTVDTFLWTGWYGIGQATAEGPIRLKAAMGTLLCEPRSRRELGRFGRAVVNSRYSLQNAAKAQLAMYENVIASQSGSRFQPRSDLAAMTRLSVYTVKRQARKRISGKISEDFNMKTVAVASKKAPSSSKRPLVMWFAGISWDDGLERAQRRMVEALSKHVRVLWIDPPRSLWKLWRGQVSRVSTGPVSVADEILRLSIVGPPATTRIGFRSIARHLVTSRAIRVAAELGEVAAVVVADPLSSFPRVAPASRTYYLTDDWISGAELMGLSRSSMRRAQMRNVARATAVIAVSPSLSQELQSSYGVQVHAIPNGSTLHAEQNTGRFDSGLTGPVAGVVGTMNERIDLDLLEAVAGKGLNLILVGPRKDRDETFGARFDTLTSRPNVRWHDAHPASAMPAILASLAVGLTPYANNAFNRASFPLKTLEYLGAGLPCVSVKSPATDWLNTDLIDAANSAEEFSRLVAKRMFQPTDEIARAKRIAFAQAHSWPARAEQFLDVIHPPSITTGGR